MSDLESAKKRLSEVLRDNIQKYWDLMKSWYRRKVFSEKAKKKNILKDRNVTMHFSPDHERGFRCEG